MHECSKKYNYNVCQQLIILDLSGFEYAKVTKGVKDAIGKISALGSNYHPECMYKNLIINAPMIFRGIWSILKLLIDKGTADKIHIYGSSYKDKLNKYVNDDNLPVEFGGRSKLFDDNNQYILEYGIWNNYSYTHPSKLDSEFKEYRKKEYINRPQLNEYYQTVMNLTNDVKEVQLDIIPSEWNFGNINQNVDNNINNDDEKDE